MLTPPSASVSFGLSLDHTIRAEVFYLSGAPERAAWEERQADAAWDRFRASPSPQPPAPWTPLTPAQIAARQRQLEAVNLQNAALARSMDKPRQAARFRLQAMEHALYARTFEPQA